MPLVSLVADNTLIYFLLSNVVTGVLNLAIDTLDVADWQPAWFSAICQFTLLTAYVVACPLIAQAVNPLSFGDKKRK